MLRCEDKSLPFPPSPSEQHVTSPCGRSITCQALVTRAPCSAGPSTFSLPCAAVARGLCRFSLFAPLPLFLRAEWNPSLARTVAQSEQWGLFFPASPPSLILMQISFGILRRGISDGGHVGQGASARSTPCLQPPSLLQTASFCFLSLSALQIL